MAGRIWRTTTSAVITGVGRKNNHAAISKTTTPAIAARVLPNREFSRRAVMVIRMAGVSMQDPSANALPLICCWNQADQARNFGKNAKWGRGFRKPGMLI
jgi:hypothetical protein